MTGEELEKRVTGPSEIMKDGVDRRQCTARGLGWCSASLSHPLQALSSSQ